MKKLYEKSELSFAIAMGFLPVTVFCRGGSLLLCIVARSAIHTLSTFASTAALTVKMPLLPTGILIVITVADTLILTKNAEYGAVIPTRKPHGLYGGTVSSRVSLPLSGVLLRNDAVLRGVPG